MVIRCLRARDGLCSSPKSLRLTVSPHGVEDGVLPWKDQTKLQGALAVMLSLLLFGSESCSFALIPAHTPECLLICSQHNLGLAD